MTNAPARVQRAIDEGYELKLGDYISNGFTLVQRDLGSFVGFFLIFILISAVGQFIPLIGPVAIGIISPALNIGMLHFAHLLKRGEMRSFNDFFAGFSRFGELFLVSFLSGLLILAAAIPGGLLILLAVVQAGGDDPNIALFLVGIILVLIPILYLSVSFSQAPNLVWFHEMSSWDAMMTSRELVGKQWWMWLVFYIVSGIIAGAGFILLCVGVLFTAPAMACSRYEAYADITGLNEADDETPEDDIIDHFAPVQ